jgi:hypothetical protein
LALVGSAAFLVGAVLGDTTLSLYALGVLALSGPLYWFGARASARAEASSAGA